MKYTPKRTISVIGHGNGRFNEGTTLREVLNILGVKPDAEQTVLHDFQELDLNMTLKQLALFDALLEVK